MEQILYSYKNALWALRPAKPLGVLSRHPCRNPKPLPRGEGLCMLGWLCIVQSPCAYTPGIRAGAILLGLPPQTKQGCLQSAAQSHCTMQWHKWLTTCTGASPLRPRFLYIIILKGQQKWLKLIYPSKKYAHSPRSAQ